MWLFFGISAIIFTGFNLIYYNNSLTFSDFRLQRRFFMLK